MASEKEIPDETQTQTLPLQIREGSESRLQWPKAMVRLAGMMKR
jgi:hypothetical protein